jgi:hypothetical protein
VLPCPPGVAMTKLRRPGALETGAAVGDGAVVGILVVGASSMLTEVLTQLDPRFIEMACALVVAPAWALACAVALRRRHVQQRLLGLLVAAPLAIVALERHIDPSLADGPWSLLVGLVLALLVLSSRRGWSVWLAPGLEGLALSIDMHAKSVAPFVIAAAVALTAGAMTTPHAAGAVEWREVERFLRDTDLPARGDGELDEARLDLVPLFRATTLLRLDPATPGPIRWRTSHGDALDVRHDRVAWSDCAEDFTRSSSSCPLATRGRVALLETATHVFVAEPHASGVWYCTLGEGVGPGALSDLGLRGIGAPREVSVLLCIGCVVALLISLASRLVGRESVRESAPPVVGYRDASKPETIAEDADGEAEARRRDLSVVALVTAIWFSMPAVSAHLHAFTVGLL